MTSKEVWIVTEAIPYEQGSVIDVFSTKELACKKYPKFKGKDFFRKDGQEYNIEQHTVDEE